MKKRFHMSFKSWVLTSAGVLLFVGFAALCLFLYTYIFNGLPSPHSLKDYAAIPLSTQIYDREGRLLYQVFKDENRTPVELEDLPEYVPQATIAIEDKDFYRHGGVSFVSGILRATRDTLRTNELQGGSTITQQLIKSALLTPERTVRRKLREIVIAVWAEKVFSKDEILEMYLNQVPYGGSAYGIEEASKVYFDKSAKDLKLYEAALLAGLPQAPTSYSPYLNPEIAKKRRDNVLRRMLEDGYINQKQYEDTIKIPVKVLPPKVDIKAPHFVFEVKKLLEEEYGLKQLEEGGLKVTTTLDLDIQQEAETIVAEEIEEIENLNVTNGAMVITRPPTGEILAMVGSKDYFEQPYGAFNVATSGTRQPGSSIKPINYAVGIDSGEVTASTMFLDMKTCFNVIGQKPYCPKNYDGTFHGPTQLRYALAQSLNIPAVKMLAHNGVENFIRRSDDFLIESFEDPSRYGLSLTLGGGEIAMTEMAQAFSTFANRGIPRKLNYVLKVENKAGDVLYEFKDPNLVQNVQEPISRPNSLVINGERAISEGTAFIISHILQDNDARTPAFGPNSELVIPEQTVSVKTGTTDDLRDNWTIGYTPNFLVTVWVGNNDFTPMNQGVVSGLTGASPIWNRAMTFLLEDQPNLPPIKPSTVQGVQVCRVTGERASGKGCESRFEYLIEGTDAKVGKVGKQRILVRKGTQEQVDEKFAENPDTEWIEKDVNMDMFGFNPAQ